MVKPPARPRSRSFPALVAVVAFAVGGFASPGVALAAFGAAAGPATGPGAGAAGVRVEAAPRVPEGWLGYQSWRVLTPPPIPLPGAGGGLAVPDDPQPGDEPDGDADRPDGGAPAAGAPGGALEGGAPDEGLPGGGFPDGGFPGEGAPDEGDTPRPPAWMPTPTAPPHDTAQAGPQPWQPTPPRTVPSSPADTRGLDELFPDHTGSPAASAEPAGSGQVEAEPAGYARPLIYSGLGGLIVSVVGIAVVLARRRIW